MGDSRFPSPFKVKPIYMDAPSNSSNQETPIKSNNQLNGASTINATIDSNNVSTSDGAHEIIDWIDSLQNRFKTLLRSQQEQLEDLNETKEDELKRKYESVHFDEDFQRLGKIIESQQHDQDISQSTQYVPREHDAVESDQEPVQQEVEYSSEEDEQSEQEEEEEDDQDDIVEILSSEEEGQDEDEHEHEHEHSIHSAWEQNRKYPYDEYQQLQYQSSQHSRQEAFGEKGSYDEEVGLEYEEEEEEDAEEGELEEDEYDEDEEVEEDEEDEEEDDEEEEDPYPQEQHSMQLSYQQPHDQLQYNQMTSSNHGRPRLSDHPSQLSSLYQSEYYGQDVFGEEADDDDAEEEHEVEMEEEQEDQDANNFFAQKHEEIVVLDSEEDELEPDEDEVEIGQGLYGSTYKEDEGYDYQVEDDENEVDEEEEDDDDEEDEEEEEEEEGEDEEEDEDQDEERGQDELENYEEEETQTYPEDLLTSTTNQTNEFSNDQLLNLATSALRHHPTHNHKQLHLASGYVADSELTNTFTSPIIATYSEDASVGIKAADVAPVPNPFFAEELEKKPSSERINVVDADENRSEGSLADESQVEHILPPHQQHHEVDHKELHDEEVEPSSDSDQGPLLPVFKTVKEETPEMTLEKLKETEVKYHIKLNAVAALESQLNEQIPTQELGQADQPYYEVHTVNKVQSEQGDEEHTTQSEQELIEPEVEVKHQDSVPENSVEPEQEEREEEDKHIEEISLQPVDNDGEQEVEDEIEDIEMSEVDDHPGSSLGNESFEHEQVQESEVDKKENETEDIQQEIPEIQIDKPEIREAEVEEEIEHAPTEEHVSKNTSEVPQNLAYNITVPDLEEIDEEGTTIIVDDSDITNVENQTVFEDDYVSPADEESEELEDFETANTPEDREKEKEKVEIDQIQSENIPEESEYPETLDTVEASILEEEMAEPVGDEPTESQDAQVEVPELEKVVQPIEEEATLSQNTEIDVPELEMVPEDVTSMSQISPIDETAEFVLENEIEKPELEPIEGSIYGDFTQAEDSTVARVDESIHYPTIISVVEETGNTEDVSEVETQEGTNAESKQLIPEAENVESEDVKLDEGVDEENGNVEPDIGQFAKDETPIVQIAEPQESSTPLMIVNKTIEEGKISEEEADKSNDNQNENDSPNDFAATEEEQEIKYPLQAIPKPELIPVEESEEDFEISIGDNSEVAEKGESESEDVTITESEDIVDDAQPKQEEISDEAAPNNANESDSIELQKEEPVGTLAREYYEDGSFDYVIQPIADSTTSIPVETEQTERTEQIETESVQDNEKVKVQPVFLVKPEPVADVVARRTRAHDKMTKVETGDDESEEVPKEENVHTDKEIENDKNVQTTEKEIDKDEVVAIDEKEIEESENAQTVEQEIKNDEKVEATEQGTDFKESAEESTEGTVHNERKRKHEQDEEPKLKKIKTAVSKVFNRLARSIAFHRISSTHIQEPVLEEIPGEDSDALESESEEKKWKESEAVNTSQELGDKPRVSSKHKPHRIVLGLDLDEIEVPLEPRRSLRSGHVLGEEQPAPYNVPKLSEESDGDTKVKPSDFKEEIIASVTTEEPDVSTNESLSERLPGSFAHHSQDKEESNEVDEVAEHSVTAAEISESLPGAFELIQEEPIEDEKKEEIIEDKRKEDVFPEDINSELYDKSYLVTLKVPGVKDKVVEDKSVSSNPEVTDLPLARRLRPRKAKAEVEHEPDGTDDPVNAELPVESEPNKVEEQSKARGSPDSAKNKVDPGSPPSTSDLPDLGYGKVRGRRKERDAADSFLSSIPALLPTKDDDKKPRVRSRRSSRISRKDSEEVSHPQPDTLSSKSPEFIGVPFDTPAARTRSRSPLKRPIEELQKEFEHEVVKKRRSSGRRIQSDNHPKSGDGDRGRKSSH